MSEKISQYSADAASDPIKSEDLLDFSNEDGAAAYDVSKKIKVSEFLTYLNANINSYYNSSGSIDSLRTIVANGFDTLWRGGGLTIQMNDLITDYALKINDSTSTERARLGYDQATSSAIFSLSNTVGEYFSANDGNVSSRYGYQIDDTLYLHATLDGDQGNILGANTFIGANTPTGAVDNGGNDGQFNTAVGHSCMTALTEGNKNVAMGWNAMNDITTGRENVAVGLGALGLITTAISNTAIGNNSFDDLLTGNYNVGLGQFSGDNITGGSNNIGIGYFTTAVASGSYSNTIAIGRNAMITGNNQMVVGDSGSSAFIRNFYFGRGVEQDSLDTTGITFQATSVKDGNLDVASDYDYIFAGSQGTGTGTGGEIRLQTAPSGTTGSTKNALVDALKVDASKVAGETRLFVYDVDNGTLERVTVGAADSGGAGFKVLRIAN